MSLRSSKNGSPSSSGTRSRPEPGKIHRSLNDEDKITRMQADLDETKNILHNTIEGVLERGEKIDDLVAKSDHLSEQSKLFYKTAKKTKPDRKKVGSVGRKRTTRIVVDETPSDMEQKQRVLKNLNMRFTNCTFTYKTPHLADSTPKKTGILSKISSTIQRISETTTCDHSFNKCLFVPLNEEEGVKDFVHKNMPDIGVSFESCKFIKRSSTLSEKIRRTFRKVFGIQFELFYINSTATIDGYKFKVNDVWDVYQYIQERIAEDA